MKLLPVVLNRGEFISALCRKNLFYDKLIILENLQQELEGIDKSVCADLDVFYYCEKNTVFHFIFANVPQRQDWLNGYPINSSNTVVNFISVRKCK